MKDKNYKLPWHSTDVYADPASKFGVIGGVAGSSGQAGGRRCRPISEVKKPVYVWVWRRVIVGRGTGRGDSTENSGEIPR